MPKMSDTMTEGVLVKWHKKVGDKVKNGELVAEIETDKATMEFESYSDGVLLYTGIEEGKAALVDSVLIIMGKEGEDYKPLLEEEAKKTAAAATPAVSTQNASTPAPTPVVEVITKPSTPTVTPPAVKEIISQATSGDERLKVSPLAKKLAEQKGIDLSMLKGSGEHGRIVKRDIDWFKPGSFVQSTTLVPGGVTKESFDEVAVSQMRKTIARRLSESMFTAPHFYLTMEIDMDEVIKARESINQITQSKIIGGNLGCKKSRRLQNLDFNFFKIKLKFTMRIPIIYEQRIVITYYVEFGNSIMHILEDMRKGHISQTDETAFEVGVNVATSEGAVVFENDLIQLIQLLR
jgi:pyruvate dehydrogenase E2 component (dihydrolipoamide acetyltransferase)